MALFYPGLTGLPASSSSWPAGCVSASGFFLPHLFVELASGFLKAAAKKYPFFESSKSFLLFFGYTCRASDFLSLISLGTHALSWKAAAKKCPFFESSKPFFTFFPKQIS